MHAALSASLRRLRGSAAVRGGRPRPSKQVTPLDWWCVTGIQVGADDPAAGEAGHHEEECF